MQKYLMYSELAVIDKSSEEEEFEDLPLIQLIEEEKDSYVFVGTEEIGLAILEAASFLKEGQSEYRVFRVEILERGESDTPNPEERKRITRRRED